MSVVTVQPTNRIIRMVSVSISPADRLQHAGKKRLVTLLMVLTCNMPSTTRPWKMLKPGIRIQDLNTLTTNVLLDIKRHRFNTDALYKQMRKSATRSAIYMYLFFVCITGSDCEIKTIFLWQSAEDELSHSLRKQADLWSGATAADAPVFTVRRQLVWIRKMLGCPMPLYLLACYNGDRT